MNLKSKIFGFAAASVLALSISTGAMAADTASQPVHVKLTPGNCSVTLTAASGSFGDWKWDGDSYELASGAGSNTVTMTSTVTAGQPKDTGGTCPITLKFAGLTNGNKTIGLNHFEGKIMTYGPVTAAGQGLETGRAIGNVPANTYTGSLTLKDLPADYAPGTYNGTVQITTGATQS